MAAVLPGKDSFSFGGFQFGMGKNEVLAKAGAEKFSRFAGSHIKGFAFGVELDRAFGGRKCSAKYLFTEGSDELDHITILFDIDKFEESDVVNEIIRIFIEFDFPPVLETEQSLSETVEGILKYDHRTEVRYYIDYYPGGSSLILNVKRTTK